MLVLSEHAVARPRSGFVLSGLLSLLLILLVAAPSLSPAGFPFLHPVNIDTDPENMLPADEPVRVFHNAMKGEFGLYDMVVVGVINRQHPQGVFNRESLGHIHALANYAQQISWEKGGEQKGVVAIDVIAPSTVDNIEQAGLGSVRFEWLMSRPPETDAEALAIADKAMRLPFLNDTLVSRDKKAMALYIPITSKNDSYEVAQRLRAKIAEFDTADEFHITGLPIAQDQFGIEMFKQMAISAPVAMLLIFILMWWFFRHVKLVIAPLVVALISVILTMGLLVVTGNTIHIMSSMIPIFVMPIAVLDSVHILSDFFDRYPQLRDRKATLKAVMEELSAPMLFTSITTCAGFGSLAFTPIPPVQTFGVFVALGVVFAWLLTVTLIPAYIMLMPESSLSGFGMGAKGEAHTPLSRMLQRVGLFTYRRGKLILAVTAVLAGGAVYGIQQIQINDNPVKWFAEDHTIRVADKALNERFGGTYMAYLALAPAAGENGQPAQTRAGLLQSLAGLDPQIIAVIENKLNTLPGDSPPAWLPAFTAFALAQQEATATDAEWEAWDRVLLSAGEWQQAQEVFKRPEVLRYMASLQRYLDGTGLVGKSNGLPDIVKTVHRELFLGREQDFRIPDTRAAVAQTLITYQSGHRPQDLWHFVTPDYRQSNLWIQLKSGDNKDMNALVGAVETFFSENPPPVALQHNWFGLTYINVIWQDEMVAGMLKAFLGSFVIVLVMMTVLFRSLWWGLLSMLPLTVTIAAIYGLIGLVGKDYDMPVAVLSALSLGLAIDYAIHFLARSRYLQQSQGSWALGIKAVFGEPARAISRNVIVIGVGFLPLLVAPLVPYQTVGFFISSILVFAGAASLLILPALLTQFETVFFKNQEPTTCTTVSP
ncbi:MMPL family transporter [Exilibacterium tricleocarpae]|uniref:MMPL family transporter n=1 Tax=Exilibacterium tricleocarpae TaxID=2591008 RepID=A0A545TAB6_9GAMM|nr:MMPL family transporter [Exilibacterium tricleocarpae]TQV74156.1 MMPL family transporter [Exilibacterium tricleocarpae]